MGYQDRDYYQYDQDVDLRPSWNQRSAVTQLIVINVAVFFVNMLVGDVTAQQQGWVNELMMLRPDTLYQPWNWWKTLTYAFAHSSSGITHLLFNMLSLYFMGRSVEARYGRREFLRIYVLSALFCGVVWMVIRGISGT